MNDTRCSGVSIFLGTSFNVRNRKYNNDLLLSFVDDTKKIVVFHSSFVKPLASAIEIVTRRAY